jgi:hypothetical protein
MRNIRLSLAYFAIAISVIAATIYFPPTYAAGAMHRPAQISRPAHHPIQKSSVPVKPKPHKPFPPIYAYGVTPYDVYQWSKVNVCEEGGNWHIYGSVYSGGLGISNYNWTAYSRGMGLPANAANATPTQQIAVAKKINAGYTVPDQHGCAAW